MKMMNAGELQEALKEYESVQEVSKFFDFEDMDVDAVHTLARAARSWLILLEGKETMVEKARKALLDTAYWADEEVIEGRFNTYDWWDALARAVIAAITESQQ